MSGHTRAQRNKWYRQLQLSWLIAQLNALISPARRLAGSSHVGIAMRLATLWMSFRARVCVLLCAFIHMCTYLCVYVRCVARPVLRITKCQCCINEGTHFATVMQRKRLPKQRQVLLPLRAPVMEAKRGVRCDWVPWVRKETPYLIRRPASLRIWPKLELLRCSEGNSNTAHPSSCSELLEQSSTAAKICCNEWSNNKGASSASVLSLHTSAPSLWRQHVSRCFCALYTVCVCKY